MFCRVMVPAPPWMTRVKFCFGSWAAGAGTCCCWFRAGRRWLYPKVLVNSKRQRKKWLNLFMFLRKDFF